MFGFSLYRGQISKHSSLSYRVYHIALDVFKPGNILWSEQNRIYTSNGTLKSLVVKTARKSRAEDENGRDSPVRITSFVQMSYFELIVVHSDSNCIAYFNRISGNESLFAGVCNQQGYEDGPATSARFNAPYSIIKDNRLTGHLILSDKLNGAVRLINTKTKTVSTLVKTRLLNPVKTIVQNKQGHIYAHVMRRIYRIGYNSGSLRLLVGGESFFNNHIGQVPKILAKNSGQISMTEIGNGVLLVSDGRLRKFWLVDLIRLTMSETHIGYSATGTTFNSPGPILKTEDGVYIADNSSIFKIECKSLIILYKTVGCAFWVLILNTNSSPSRQT